MNDHLKIYNTYTKKVEKFIPAIPNHVTLYLCGPTVYSPPHLGHARSAIIFDVMVRYLRHIGNRVEYVRNITDVGHLMHDNDSGEDKIILQAQKKKVNPMAIAQEYTHSYHKALAQLNVEPPTIEPRATGHIIEQIELIQTLIKKKYAYQVNGSVYFNLQKYIQKHAYGTLSGRDTENMRTMRILEKTGEKQHPNDFALWKKAPNNHLMKWSSPWGEGFPGWHLECTAMSQKYLGAQFDIHGGGIDLVFPHHECEIAQAITATGQTPARYWVHHNLVTIHQQKMSKSAQNFISLQACFTGDHPLLTQAYPPMVLRFFMLQAHYRNPTDISDQALQAAHKAYYKLMNGLEILTRLTNTSYDTTHKSSPDYALSQKIQTTCNQCYEAMNEDFNTPKVLVQLFQLCKYINQLYYGEISLQQIEEKDWQLLKKTYSTFLPEILGLQKHNPIVMHTLLEDLIKLYKDAKKHKNYAQVETIRNMLQKQNISIQDSNQEIHWSYTT